MVIMLIIILVIIISLSLFVYFYFFNKKKSEVKPSADTPTTGNGGDVKNINKRNVTEPSFLTTTSATDGTKTYLHCIPPSDYKCNTIGEMCISDSIHSQDTPSWICKNDENLCKDPPCWDLNPEYIKNKSKHSSSFKEDMKTKAKAIAAKAIADIKEKAIADLKIAAQLAASAALAAL